MYPYLLTNSNVINSCLNTYFHFIVGRLLLAEELVLVIYLNDSYVPEAEVNLGVLNVGFGEFTTGEYR